MIRNILNRIGWKHGPDVTEEHGPGNAPVSLVSYPKSGSTWVRFVIGNYLSGGRCDFHNLDDWVPDVHSTGAAVKGNRRSLIQKTHFPDVGEASSAVYLARDGRDVAVSYFMHQLKNRAIADDYGFEQFLADFNHGDIFPHVSWSDHVISWCGKDVKDLLVVRYEDLLEDAGKEIARIMRFCGIEVDEVLLNSALGASSFEAMKTLELAQHHTSRHLSGTRTDIRHVRQGKAGTWREYFDVDALDEFMRIHGYAMKLLGYE